MTFIRCREPLVSGSAVFNPATRDLVVTACQRRCGMNMSDQLLDEAARAFLSNGDNANLTVFERLLETAVLAMKAESARTTLFDLAERRVRHVSGSLSNHTADRLQILLEIIERQRLSKPARFS